MKEFNEEEFLRRIHSIPYWVRNGDDLLKYVRHISYRLCQAEAQISFLESSHNLKENYEYQKTYNDILSRFDDSYKNCKDDNMISFDEVMNKIA